MASWTRDISFSSAVAGFVAVLVGYTSSVAIVFRAAEAVGATPAQLASWMWALGIGMGLTTILLSWRSHQPILTAWSTPGAALIAGTAGISMPDAIGAFVVCGVLILLSGLTRAFERVMDRIPMAVAAALLAGVLSRFALEAVLSATSAPETVLPMAVAFLLARRYVPRYAIPIVLLVGVLAALIAGRLRWSSATWAWAYPLWTTPGFTGAAIMGLAVPLFVVTMASQNLPGVAAQRAAGFNTHISTSITTTGLATVMLAPFGGYTFNLAAITAAICLGREANEDPQRRYTAAMVAGLLYVALGLAGGAVAGMLLAFPRELIAAIAGLALLGAIASSLVAAFQQEAHRDAAIITFLVTLSGVSAFGAGSAFWGVVAGLSASLLSQRAPHH